MAVGRRDGEVRQDDGVDEEAEQRDDEEEQLRAPLDDLGGHAEREADRAQPLHREREHDAARDEVQDHVQVDEQFARDVVFHHAIRCMRVQILEMRIFLSKLFFLNVIK